MWYLNPAREVKPLTHSMQWKGFTPQLDPHVHDEAAGMAKRVVTLGAPVRPLARVGP